MAEPLLRRTFSKLRAKERFRRKTDPKLTEVTEKVELFQSPPSTGSTSGHAEPESPEREECTIRSQITVSKKQNWAKLPSTCRDPVGTDLVYGPLDWDLCSGKSEVSKQAWNQLTLSEDGLKRNRSDLELEFSAPCNSVEASLPELTPSSTTFTDVCVSSSSAKISGQGAYLQHLDRSSRAWVLSTGKPQASDEAQNPARITEWRQGPDGDGNIWYNPIPEEDDSRASGEADREKYGDPWRKRDQKRSGGLTNQTRDFQTEVDLIRTDSSDLVTLQSDCIIPASVVNSESSAAPKRSPGEGGNGSSVIDKIKSPGTVRRLSMKMRKLPELRRKLSLRSSRNQRHGQSQGNASSAPGASDEALPPNACKESSNIISKYHLDSSAPARPRRRSSRMRSASKGGYLSDGDSPELLPKGQGSKGSPTPQDSLAVADAESFRLYSLTDQPRCAQRLSGLLTVHLLGVEELLRPPRIDATKEVFCAIQVDGVTRARTSLLTCRGACLPLNHTFNLELERARLLKLVILTPTTASANIGSCALAAPARNRVCCLGAVAIPSLFKASRSQQLCVRLEPRGLLYVKLTLLEQFVTPFPRLSDLPPPTVFGVELRPLVEKEASALGVPLIIQKCVSEIERRGLRVVGLYRLCGSAAVKKELRDAFEKDSAAVSLNDELYPDVNVITGILKDYLRELPSPLITRTLYEVVLEAMMVRPACRHDSDAPRSQDTVALLQCLPEAEKATLSFLLDHLSLVASYSDSNRMTCQNLAVCFGPVLLTPTQESWQAGLTAPGSGALMGSGAARGRSFAHSEEIASAVDFKRHIEALHYLLQLWPVPKDRVIDDSDQSQVISSPVSQSSSLWQSLPSVQDEPVVSRRGRGLQDEPVVSRRGRGLQDEPVVSHRGRGLQDEPVVSHRGRGLQDESVVSHRGRGLQDDPVVSRRGRGRLESPPCNRYAGDWSVCGRDFMSNDEADYDEVAGSESDDDMDEAKKRDVWASPDGLFVDDFALDFDAPFTCRLSLKDFDTLISDLERELAKQINICL
ncbi:rho GTPase-activating protein SYDE1 isoform X2 [Pimephales promelas]|uniref:rho GTPase-activating protein SYDE1 isoform X2 n=1 Tax=Pimephales promelas TaxID=90988 RepID=UPI001955E092|nr:rho GTPase-activating protein SYDE1 isoform X2 [Pimephales promelas]